MDADDRRIEKLIRAIRNENANEQASAVKRLLEHIKKHPDGDLWSWIERQHNISKALVRREMQEKIDVLEAENQSLVTRIKLEAHFAQMSLQGQVSQRDRYKALLQEWLSHRWLHSQNDWVSTTNLHETFEQLYAKVIPCRMTTKTFSILVSELSGLRSVRGGERGDRKGFPFKRRSQNTRN
jgi:hypothetical protein